MSANVIATIMRNKMQNRAGYLSINELLDEMTMYYTFKNCIKVHETNSFINWICYWEGSPVAVKCIVSSSVLANGFTKVAIISKEIVDVAVVGEYKSNKNYLCGYIINAGAFVEENSTQSYINNAISNSNIANIDTVPNNISSNNTSNNSHKNSKTLSDDEIQHFKEVMQKNWGCKFKTN